MGGVFADLVHLVLRVLHLLLDVLLLLVIGEHLQVLEVSLKLGEVALLLLLKVLVVAQGRVELVVQGGDLQVLQEDRLR